MLAKLSTFVLIGFLTACGGGGGGGATAPTPPTAGGGDSVADSLTALGIDTSDAPLTDENGNPLPESYTPLGARPRLNKLDEIFTLGASIRPTTPIPATTIMSLDPLSVAQGARQDPTTATRTQLAGWTTTTATPHPDAPWAGNDYIRAGASGDINDDGLDDALIVYQQKSGAYFPVQLMVVQNTASTDPSTASFSNADPIVISASDSPMYLDIVTGDFEGDGAIDAAVVLTETSQIKIIFLKNTNGILALSGKALVLPQLDAATAQLQAVVRVGNLDYDSTQELAVVVNEYHNRDSIDNNSSHLYLYKFDNATSDFKSIPLPNNPSGTLSSQFNGSLKIVAEGNVALGDVDGDGLDEVILGGLEQGDRIANASSTYVVSVLNDAAHGLTEMAHAEQARIANPTAAADTRKFMRYMHLNAVDADGDGVKEIQANEFIFDNLTHTTAGQNGVATLTRKFYMDPLLFIFANDTMGLTSIFSNNTSNMVAANVLHLSDGREQIIVHSESVPSQRVRVFGLDNDDNWSELYAYGATSFTGGNSSYDTDFTFPQRSLQIIPTNVNNDTLVLKYVPGSHKFVYTEPVVIAALAAAPCWAKNGQDTSACSTAYGTTTDSTKTKDNSVTTSVSATAGLKTPDGGAFVDVSAQAKVTIDASLTYAHSVSGSISKTVTYTAGGLSDSVIFTSVPMDIYTYTIIRDGNPADEGLLYQLQMPRSPITLMVSRDFYNSHLAPGQLPIDSAIFQHTPGNPFTYMTSEQKGTLVRTVDLVENPWLASSTALSKNPFDSVGAVDNILQSEPQTVGQQNPGTSNTAYVEVSLTNETSNTATTTLGGTFEVEATAYVVVGGFSIGLDVERGMSISTGKTTTFSGTVSNIDTPFFIPANQYSFGIFSYYYQETNPTLSRSANQQFQVVNYWVDPLQ
jgi:hypothetical protein